MNSGWFKGPVLVGALVVVAVVGVLRQGHHAPAQGVRPLASAAAPGVSSTTFVLSSAGPGALESLMACLPDNCDYIERDRARRAPLSAADQRGAQGLADRIAKAVPASAVGEPSCDANGRCQWKVEKATVADVRKALQGVGGATVRAATAADPAAPGYVVAAVPHGEACVVVTVGNYYAVAVSVVGQLPGGTCLAPVSKPVAK